METFQVCWPCKIAWKLCRCTRNWSKYHDRIAKAKKEEKTTWYTNSTYGRWVGGDKSAKI